MPLTPDDVRSKQFTPVRLREGYDVTEVDSFLDEVEAELERLLAENEELRAKLAAAQRAGADQQRPVDQTAAVSALAKTTQELGGALGIAIFGTVGATVYRHTFDAHVPSGLPAATVEGARQTMGAATALAVHLPAQLAQAMLRRVKGSS